MSHFIRISEPNAGPDEPRRLNPYPGRHLSQREFELQQVYVDDRIAPLITSQPPGIVHGLELRQEGSGDKTLLHIQPGVAIGQQGKLLRLYYPMSYTWIEFLDSVEEHQGKALDDGLYLITLYDSVRKIRNTSEQKTCARTEVDPLDERRLETVILPAVQFISANAQLMAMPQHKAANRICVRFLNESPVTDSGAISLGLLKVVDRQPSWIDTIAGRYLAEPDNTYRTFLAHTVAHLEQWMGQNTTGDATKSLASQFDLDYLPAAAPLPSILLQEPAGTPPRLMFQPSDLQIDLIPIPASTLSGAMARELPRGTVDLVHGLSERIRLLLAIPDQDYRPDLFDLPERDTALEDELFQRETEAATAWRDWWKTWQLLFGGMSEDECKLNNVPNYQVGCAAPATSRPSDPDAYRTSLIEARLKALSQSDPKATLPEPYASHKTQPHQVQNYTRIPAPKAQEEQLFKQRQKLEDDIKQLKDDLHDSFKLLNEMNDYLHIQRQHLDGITISFSALAGGVAGDGSGSNMIRWNGAIAFDPTPNTKS